MSQNGSVSEFMLRRAMYERFRMMQAIHNSQVEDETERDAPYTLPPFQSFNTRTRFLSEEFRPAFLTYLPYNVRPFLSEECLSASLSTFEPITIRELYFKNRHPGKVLYGLISIEQPVTNDLTEDIGTVLSDANGTATFVIMDKRIWHSTFPQGDESHFALGMQVAIKEPLIEHCEKFVLAVRVINPAQLIVLHNVDADCYSPAESSDVTTMEEIQTVRLEGNRLFAEENWAAAVIRYSRCINHAVRNLESITSKENLNSFLISAYSNRAEARLRLHHYEDAMSDADSALEIDSKHVKTLARKGRAAYGLGLYLKACKAFKAALQESPHVDQSLVISLNASTKALKQSLGKYSNELAGFFLRGSSLGEVPSCADFVGPVEVRRVGYGHGRRGLFATRLVKAGELLAVSNPLVTTRHQRKFGCFNMTVWEELIIGIVNQITTSKRQMARLWSLTSHGQHEMEIPSMELLKPGTEWVPPGSEKLEVDLGRIRGIVKLNTTNKIDCESDEGLSGIWVLPSFVNHSCAPNCLQKFLGETMILRALVDIMEGEEITMSYVPAVVEDVDSRRAKTETFDFSCRCERCLLEETFKAQLSKIRNVMPKLVEEAQIERRSLDGRTGLVSRKLSKVINDVEAVIQSRDSKLGPKQRGWIRVTFFDAYLAKLLVEVAEGDSQSKIRTLGLMLDMVTAVSVNFAALQTASALLWEVEKKCSKRSNEYQLTLDRVLAIYKAAFGKLPEDIVQKLTRVGPLLFQS